MQGALLKACVASSLTLSAEIYRGQTESPKQKLDQMSQLSSAQQAILSLILERSNLKVSFTVMSTMNGMLSAETSNLLNAPQNEAQCCDLQCHLTSPEAPSKFGTWHLSSHILHQNGMQERSAKMRPNVTLSSMHIMKF